MRWGGESNQVEFSVALAPAITFLGVAQHEPGGTRGTSFRVSFSALHSSIQGPMGGSLVLLVDGRKIEVDLSLALAHYGRINLSHKNNDALDFQTAVAGTHLNLLGGSLMQKPLLNAILCCEVHTKSAEPETNG